METQVASIQENQLDAKVICVADDPLINAALLLQRELFAQQIDLYNDILNRASSNDIDLTDKDVQVPDFLLKRANVTQAILASDKAGNSYGLPNLKGRLLTNEEIALLDVLDADGMLSSSARLTNFIVFMTRASKVEQRALCLHVLGRRTTNACGSTFVKMSGFKLLHRWLKLAEEEGRIEELRLIVAVCKSLPFDAEALKQSEIGKSIKKLLKYRPPQISNTNYHSTNGGGNADAANSCLMEEVKILMKQWTEQINETSKDKAPSVPLPELPALVSSLTKKEFMPEKLENLSETKSDSSTNVNNTENSIAESKESQDDPAPSTMAAKLLAANKKALNTNTSTSASRNPNSSASTKSDSKVSSSLSWLKTTTPTSMTLGGNPGLQLGSNRTVPGISIPSVPPRERKKDTMIEEAKRQLALNANSNESSPRVDSNPSSDTVTQPVRSILKRKAEDADRSNKRARLAIHWADDQGGELGKVFTFEVEKIRSTVSGYKSHKDLVKKERQLEKDAHTMKIHETMSKAVDWKVPLPLSLSIDILDTLNAPVNSYEQQIQEKRIAHMLETRYLDDSLIPNDPDTLPSAYTNEPSVPAAESTVSIPWNLPGEQSSDSGRGSNFIEGTNLPIVLQTLDPSVLAFLASNEAYVAHLVREDGSIDEGRLQTLQNQLLGNHGHAPTPQYIPTYSHPPNQPVPLQYQWQQNIGVPPQQAYIPPQPMLGNPQYNPFTVPSAAHIGQQMNYMPQYPTFAPPPPVNPKKGTVQCRMYMTKEGCRFGDRCDFAHHGPGGTIAGRGPGLQSRPGPGHKKGPGGRQL